MPRNTVCYEILIASPGDVSAERTVIEECIEDWNAANSRSTGIILQARRWELDVYPDVGERPQAIINKQIVADSDMVIGVFWHRLGSPTGKADSGTVEEIQQFVDAGRPTSLYFSQQPIPMQHDPAQLAAVQNYRAVTRGKSVAFDFGDVHAFRRMVTRHLAARMSDLMDAAGEQPSSKPKGEFNAWIQTTRLGKPEGVRTAQFSVIIENRSETKRIEDYFCTVTVPRASMTHESPIIMGEIPSANHQYRKFRWPGAPDSYKPPIFPGDKQTMFGISVAVDQLKMKESHLAGDYDGTLADKVKAEVVVEGELLTVEKTINEIMSAF